MVQVGIPRKQEDDHLRPHDLQRNRLATCLFLWASTEYVHLLDFETLRSDSWTLGQHMPGTRWQFSTFAPR